MPLYIATDAGFPEPGATVNATLYAVMAVDATAAATQVTAQLGLDAVDLFMIDASTITAIHVARSTTLSTTPIVLPPLGPPA